MLQQNQSPNTNTHYTAQRHKLSFRVMFFNAWHWMFLLHANYSQHLYLILCNDVDCKVIEIMIIKKYVAVQKGMLHSAGLCPELSGPVRSGDWLHFNKPSFCFETTRVLERSNITISWSSLKSYSLGRIRKHSCATLSLATLFLAVGIFPHPYGIYR
jgi:hypothetical protein